MTRTKLEPPPRGKPRGGPGRLDAPFKIYPPHYAAPPAPPGSLTPHAMDELDDSVDTLRRRRRVHRNPTFHTGLAILVTGAFIGGMFGLAQRIQQKYAPEASSSAGLENIQEDSTPTRTSALPQGANDPPSSDTRTQDDAFGVVVPAPGPAPFVLVTKSRSKEIPAKRAAPTRHTATKAGSTKEHKARVAKRPKGAAPSDPADGDSERVLKAAMGATENTL